MQQFIRQITSCCLSSRMHRVVMAIFSQTIDFNKFEDDMNGTRLQQLTNIFPHHANEAVRGLEAMNALITREGKYGKYMSVNFDFEQWGEGDCDKYPINDPYILLDNEEDRDTSAELTAEEYDKLEDYEKRELDAFLSGETVNETAKTTPKTTPNEKSQARWKTDHEQLLQNLTRKLRGLEAQVNTLLEERAILAKVKKAAKTAEKSKTAPSVVTKPEIASEIQPEVQPEPDNGVTEEPVVTTKPEPETRVIAQAVNHPPETTLPTIEATVLNFPSQLNQDQRYDAEKLVRRADDKAQVLLDLLAKRLRNTANPVRSPIAYLNNLLTRLQNNRLDMPYTTTNSIVPAEPRPIRESEVRRAEYQEAVADCIHMEGNIKLMARQDNLSFDECLNKLDLNEMWEGIKDRFKAAKEALVAIQPIGAEPV